MRATRIPTAAKVVAGISVLAFPATALAVTQGPSAAAAAQATGAAIQASGPHHTVAYGAETVVRGSAPASAAGTELALQYHAAGAKADTWRTVATDAVPHNGRFRLEAALRRSGRLRVVSQGSTTAVHSNLVASPVDTTASSTPLLLDSTAQRVTVAPALSLKSKGLNAIAGQVTNLRGRLLPGTSGRRVVLDARQHGRWTTIGSARTGKRGGFDIRYAVPAVAGETVRVAFAGDRYNTAAHSTSTRLNAMQYVEVSWYDDAGDTACGFHATYGIASRTLPCGTKVTFSYGGRSLVATVDDRGPYVYSRTYDLNQNVAGALGMNGVASMLASVS
jgi:hypothetical protein